MRIGILTFHDADNYGAVLQCFALQEVLSSMGHSVDIINYKQSHVIDVYKSKITLNVKDFKLFSLSNIRSLVRKCLNMNSNRKKHSLFNSFRIKYLHLTQPQTPTTIPTDYDAYFVGSDQVWSYSCCGGIDPIYWGNFNRKATSKLVGYAISGNGDFLSHLNNNEIQEKASAFDSLSFRESHLSKIVKSATGQQYKVVLDPTLLTQESTWDSLIDSNWKKRKKYVVIYQARTNRNNPDLIKNKAEKYAIEHGCDIINLSLGEYGIVDFLSSIKYADSVFTSSFHATVFSVIFGTPFFTFCLNDGKDERYVALLKSLHLDNNLVYEHSEITDKILLNKVLINKYLGLLCKDSLDFITTSLIN